METDRGNIMGKAGSVRIKSSSRGGLSAMQDHEKRLDLMGKKRRIREVDPLIYSPHGDELDLMDSYEAHVAGAKRNAKATKLALHAFVQFPTDIEITPQSEQMMLDQAVDFIEKHHGGRAVFRARLDRDEAGRHGVDVFFAPRYEKKTAKGSTEWVSLTKFGKELALAKFGERPKKDKKTEEPVLDKNGKPVMVRNDNSYFQGQALQDLWFQHLRNEMQLDWVERGEKKLGRDPDRLEPEEYKLKQDREKLEQQREADIADAIERNKILERTAELAEAARKKLMDTAKAKAAEAENRVADLEAEAARLLVLAEETRDEIDQAQGIADEQWERATAALASQSAAEARREAVEAEIGQIREDALSGAQKAAEAILSKAQDDGAKEALRVTEAVSKRLEATLLTEGQKALLTAERERDQWKGAFELLRDMAKKIIPSAIYEKLRDAFVNGWEAHPANPDRKPPRSSYTSGPSSP